MRNEEQPFFEANSLQEFDNPTLGVNSSYFVMKQKFSLVFTYQVKDKSAGYCYLLSVLHTVFRLDNRLDGGSAVSWLSIRWILPSNRFWMNTSYGFKEPYNIRIK